MNANQPRKQVKQSRTGNERTRKPAPERVTIDSVAEDIIREQFPSLKPASFLDDDDHAVCLHERKLEEVKRHLERFRRSLRKGA